MESSGDGSVENNVPQQIQDLLTLAEQFRLDNEQLKANFLQLQEHCDGLQRTNQGLQAAKSSLETALQQQTDQIHHWQEQLIAKSREFDELQIKLANTPDLENLRVQLLQELDIRKHLEQELEESDKFRVEYFKLNGAHELMKTKFEQRITEMERLLAESRSEYEALYKEHTNVVEDLEKKLQDISGTEQVRILEREKVQLQLEIGKLKDEVDDVRREKEKIRIAKEDASVANAKSVSEEQSKSMGLQAEVDRLTRKVQGLEDALKDEDRKMDDLHHKASSLEKEKSLAQSDLQETKQTLEQERQTAKNTLSEKERQWNAERDSVTASIATLTRQLNEATQSNKDLQHQMAILEKDTAARLKMARDEESLRLKSAEERYKSLGRQFDESERTHQRAKEMLSDEVDRLRKDLQNVRAEKHAVEMEKAALQDRVNKMSATISQLKLTIEGLEQKVADSNLLMDKCKRAVDEKEIERASASAQIERLQLTIEFLKKDVTNLRDELDGERKTNVENIDTVKKAWAKERALFQQKLGQLNTELDAVKNEYAHSKLVAKKVKRKLQEQISQLQKNEQDLLKRLGTAEAGRVTAQQALSQEKQSAKRRECERDKDRLQLLVDTQGLNLGGGESSAGGGAVSPRTVDTGKMKEDILSLNARLDSCSS